MSEQVILTVTGMKCGGCVSAVTDALNAVENVESVEVSLEEKKAVVNGDADVAQLIAAVEGAGFKAEQ